MKYKELKEIRDKAKEISKKGRTSITLIADELGYTREEFNPIIDEMLIKGLAHLELINYRPTLIWD